MDASEAILVAIPAALAGLAPAVGMLLRSRSDNRTKDNQSDSDSNKAKSEVVTSEVAAAAALYRELVIGLRADVNEMFALVKQLEVERLTCREESAGLKADNRNLKAANDELRAELAEAEKARRTL